MARAENLNGLLERRHGETGRSAMARARTWDHDVPAIASCNEAVCSNAVLVENDVVTASRSTY